MNVYRTSFQCPDTGCDTEAVYTFGRLACAPISNAAQLEPSWWRDQHGTDAEAKRAEYIEETRVWCRAAGGKFRSVEAAEQHLVSLGCDFDTLELA